MTTVLVLSGSEPRPAGHPRARGLRHGHPRRPRRHLHRGLGDGFEVEHVQSNHEGDLVDAIRTPVACAAIVINGAAFTHYAWAIHDALAAYDGKVVEVHSPTRAPGRRGATRR